MHVRLSGAVKSICFTECQESVVLLSENEFHSISAKDASPQFTGHVTGAALAHQFYGTGLVCLVGSGSDAGFPSSTVRFWDRTVKQPSVELAFDSCVVAARFTTTRVIIALTEHLHIYDHDFTLKKRLDTHPNPGGVLAASPNPSTLAFPASVETGRVAVYDAETLHATAYVDAHQAPLAALALSPDGSRLATASAHGTVVRVFALPSAVLIATLRRGFHAALLYGLTFSPDAAFLAAASRRPTVHIFRIGDQRPDATLPRVGAATASDAASRRSSTPDSARTGATGPGDVATADPARHRRLGSGGDPVARARTASEASDSSRPRSADDARGTWWGAASAWLAGDAASAGSGGATATATATGTAGVGGGGGAGGRGVLTSVAKSVAEWIPGRMTASAAADRCFSRVEVSPHIDGAPAVYHVCALAYGVGGGLELRTFREDGVACAFAIDTDSGAASLRWERMLFESSDAPESVIGPDAIDGPRGFARAR